MGVSVEERNRGLEPRSEAADDCFTEVTTGMGRPATQWTLLDLRRSWVRSASRFETGKKYAHAQSLSRRCYQVL
jgi:hypothetical protein